MSIKYSSRYTQLVSDLCSTLFLHPLCPIITSSLVFVVDNMFTIHSKTCFCSRGKGTKCQNEVRYVMNATVCFSNVTSTLC